MPPHTLRGLVVSIGMLALCTAAVSQPVRLRELATVGADRIALSDLLPAEAPSDLRRTGAEVTLGASPNLGTTRVLMPAEIARALAAQPGLLSQLELPARVLVRRDGFPLDRDSIWAVARRFLKTTDWHIPDDAFLNWDGEIVTRKASPALAVTHAKCDLSRKVTQLWMRCVDRGACPDFLVRVPNTICSPNRLGQPPSPRAKSASAAEQMQEGSKAWLIIDSGNLRLELAVVCLQRGSIGQTIRVVDPSSRRVFLAEIVGARALHMRIES